VSADLVWVAMDFPALVSVSCHVERSRDISYYYFDQRTEANN